MRTVEEVYTQVDKLLKKGRDVRSCCRSVAKKIGVSREEVEVLLVSYDNRWYEELGYDVRMKI